MTEPIIKDMTDRMEKAISAFQNELAKLRTGRASPALLESVRVDYYGTPTPLNQMATISVPDAKLLVVQPYDPSVLGEIEKALHKADLGLTPQNDGRVIRLPVPPLTEERRKELVKVVNKFAEDGRVAVRNIRRSGMDQIKSAEKEKKITEDDRTRAQTKIQELTDGFIKKVDRIADTKSKEVLEV